METQQLGDYITIDYASKLLGVTYGKMNWLVQSGEVPHVKLGHTRLVKLSDLKRLQTVEQENAPKL